MKSERDTVMHTWTIQSNWNGLEIVGGSGAVFWDKTGKEYIDMASMAECSNLGHQHPKVVAAIKQQAAEMCFVTSAWGSAPRAKLAEKLLEISGFKDGKVFFTLGGADAVENAVKFARWFSKKHDGKIITRHRSYHGATYATMKLSGDSRGWTYGSGISNVVHILPPYCYRCPFKLKYGSCGIQCAGHLADVIKYEGPETISAVLMEPNAGTNGIIPPPAYWPLIVEICHHYKIPLIADEVMSGFGRCGNWFAWQEYGESGKPDIIVCAKGLTGAHIPLGAVIVSQKIAEYFEDKMLWSGLTYSGHPLCCAAGLAAIEAYEEAGLIERSVKLGDYFYELLKCLESRHFSIGDIRGKGLFWIIELVKNRQNKWPLSEWPETAASLKTLVKEGLERGVFFAVRGNLIILAPPLVIKTEQLEKAVEVLDKLLVLCDQLKF